METIEVINRRLKERCGVYLDGQPLYRIVWSEDQLEKRKSDYSPEGFKLPYTQVYEVRKYGQYIHNKYVMERLVEVPEALHSELLHKLSYEPIWVFEDNKGNALPPVWGAIEIIIHTINENAAKAVGAKYTAPGWSREETEVRVKQMEEMLFGNETPVGDALAYGTGIVVPGGKSE